MSNETLRAFAVIADRETGEWLGAPEECGTVDTAAFYAQPDTENCHYDTFENDGETCAIFVTWA